MNRITELLKELGVDEASDMGLQVVRDAAGKAFPAFVATGLFKCARCGADVEFISKVDEQLVALGGVRARLDIHRQTVAEAREKHAAACKPVPR